MMAKTAATMCVIGTRLKAMFLAVSVHLTEQLGRVRLGGGMVGDINWWPYLMLHDIINLVAQKPPSWHAFQQVYI